ncbi:MAG: DUF99 family protein [Nitrososphaera sp.]|jgi:endonuclease V-like protein UPF0215 family
MPPNKNKNNNTATTIRRVHAGKKGVRVFALAESFRKGQNKSVLAGVVMRRDLVIDGIAFGKATISGSDATDSIIAMIQSLSRTDINCIMLDGLVISMYNIVDGERLSAATGLATLAITFEDSSGLQGAIKHHFKRGWKARIAQYKKLGKRERVVLWTGKPLYIRRWNLSQTDALALLDAFTLQGALPEPLKVAKLAARAFGVSRGTL